MMGVDDQRTGEAETGVTPDQILSLQDMIQASDDLNLEWSARPDADDGLLALRLRYCGKASEVMPPIKGDLMSPLALEVTHEEDDDGSDNAGVEFNDAAGISPAQLLKALDEVAPDGLGIVEVDLSRDDDRSVWTMVPDAPGAFNDHAGFGMVFTVDDMVFTCSGALAVTRNDGHIDIHDVKTMLKKVAAVLPIMRLRLNNAGPAGNTSIVGLSMIEA